LNRTGLSGSVHRQTDTQTKVKTVYPPVLLRSLGGYNKLIKISNLGLVFMIPSESSVLGKIAAESN